MNIAIFMFSAMIICREGIAMKRLTIEGMDISTDYVLSGLTISTITEMIRRLQEYEDTGLEPKEIRIMISDKETLI